MRDEETREIRNISQFCFPGKEYFPLYGNVKNGEFVFFLSKSSPNQNLPFIVYRKGNRIEEKTSQLSSNYLTTTEPLVTDHLMLFFKKKMCVRIVRMTGRLGFFIKKEILVER